MGHTGRASYPTWDVAQAWQPYGPSLIYATMWIIVSLEKTLHGFKTNDQFSPPSTPLPKKFVVISGIAELIHWSGIWERCCFSGLRMIFGRVIACLLSRDMSVNGAALGEICKQNLIQPPRKSLCHGSYEITDILLYRRCIFHEIQYDSILDYTSIFIM